MSEQLTLPGCRPTPLASYLKALGVLRLLSSAANNVTGEPVDAEARGWWDEERFCLRTVLSREDIVSFFLDDYAPSPVLAPWNGGSGFYAKDNKDGFRPLISGPVAARFQPFATTVRIAADTLQCLGLSDRPTGDAKTELVAMLRSRLPERALPWVDAALVLSGGGLRFPQLLGTGGNDGRLDFTNNLMRRLFSESRPSGIFDAPTGEPSATSGPLLRGALFDAPVHELTGAKVGQFSPGGAGGPNATTGYEGEAAVNPWDYVFMLEGAAMFACAATRRHESNSRARASFPFTVAASGAGWGGIEVSDESEARAEFWAPLWNRPARSCEIEALFGEGRAVTNGRTASDGLDFARALGALGTSRGFSEFQRYGFFQRAGKSYYAAAIGRRQAEPSPGAELMADLDAGNWLGKVRRYGRDGNQPAAVRNAVKLLEDAAFELLAPQCSPGAVRAVLESIGRLGEWLGNSPKGRESVPPPPRLSGAWLLRADDGSAEFRVAAALAGLGIRFSPYVEHSDDAEARSGDPRTPPMAAHLAPLTNGAGSSRFEQGTFFRGHRLLQRRSWASDNSPPTAVWGHGDLVGNMIAVLERRLVEAPIRGLADKPLGSASCARLSDVTAFLAGDFDDARCSALLSGMVWAQPARLPATEAQISLPRAAPPFPYAALKPVFSTDDSLRRLGALPAEGSLPVPPGLVGQLRAGGQDRDGRAVNRAVGAAFSRARSSGLPSAFDPTRSGGGTAAPASRRFGAGVRPDRMAAAMLIPITEPGLASLLRRAYPDSTPDTAIPSSEEAHERI